MLSLGRLQRECIVVGSGDDLVLIQVVMAEHGKARLAVSAPQDQPIARLEILTGPGRAAVEAVLQRRRHDGEERRAARRDLATARSQKS